jgi:hypothetical protein
MPDVVNTIEHQDTNSEASSKAAEIKVVAHVEDEPPCQELGPVL